MSTNREYPAGALEAVYGTADAAFFKEQGAASLDALAAMSPKDRAALARWLTRGVDFEADEAFEARIEAATVKRITTLLRSEDAARRIGRASAECIAMLVERRLAPNEGGPDAVK